VDNEHRFRVSHSNTVPTTHDHIAQGLHSVTNTTVPSPLMDPAQLQFCKQQHRLRWKHMIYGYSSAWIITIKQQEPPLHRQKFFTKLSFLHGATWHLHNSYLNPTTLQEEDCTWLKDIVLQILHKAQQDHHLANQVGYVQIEHIMCQPNTNIHQFITQSVELLQMSSSTPSRQSTDKIF